MNKKLSANYQDLIKFVAIILMFLDHAGYYFIPDLPILRVIGRPVMAIFCFFAGYNYRLTPNFNILSLGFILLTTSYAMRHSLEIDNVLIPIFFGQCYISVFYRQLKNFFSAYIHFVVLAFFAPFVWDYSWYGTYIFAIMVMGYYIKQSDNDYKLAWAICLFLSFLFPINNFDFLRYAVDNLDFTNIYLILLAIINLIIYRFITYKDPNFSINIDLTFISRNTLYIYFFNVIIMEIIWFYLIMAKY